MSDGRRTFLLHKSIDFFQFQFVFNVNGTCMIVGNTQYMVNARVLIEENPNRIVVLTKSQHLGGN